MTNLIFGHKVKMQMNKMKNRILSLTVTLALSLSSFAMNVETDRAWYLAGEAMKVSVTDDDALIAYAELCDTQGMAAGTIISLKANESFSRQTKLAYKGTGTIELPPDLHSGYYLLTVYARGDASLSHRLVAVVNPLRKSVDDDIEWTESDSCWVTRERTEFGSTASPRGHGELSVDLSDERETEGHIIKARVKNAYGGHTFRASQIRSSLSIVGKQIHYFEGKMVNDSLVVFYTYGIHGILPLIISATTSTGVSLPVEIISPFATLLPKKLPHLVFHYKRSEVEARSLDMQRRQRLRVGELQSETNGRWPKGKAMDLEEATSPYDDALFGTKPDITYNLDEYRQFLTVREVLLEYVTSVERKKVDGITKLFVLREQRYDNSVLPPLVLIDGMPVYDTEQLLNYDARRLHYINIFEGQYTFGHDIYNGVISFVTRSGRLTNYPTDTNAQYLIYEFP